MKNTSALLILGMAAACGSAAAQRPNIVLVLADDWGFPNAAAYGDKAARMPNFERVVSQGMLFTQAYCSAPSSSPSRAAILTGNYPHALGEAANLWARFPADLQVYPSLLEQQGYVIGLEGKGWAPGEFKTGHWPHNPAGWEHDDLAKYIDEVPADKPICFWFGSHYPHRPYDDGIGAANGFDPAAIEVSPNMPDAAAVRGDLADYYYYCYLYDKRAGEILQALERNGRLKNTIFVMTGDNGYPFPRAKANLYDEGSHIPLAIMWPGVIGKPSVYTGFVNLLDLAPTFCEAAGVKPLKPMQGRSLVAVLQGKEKASARPAIYLERERHANVRAGNVGYPSRAVKTSDFIYIRNLRPDRWPAGDPKYQSSLAPFGDCDNGPAKKFMVENKAAYPELFDRAFGKRPAEELYDLHNDPAQQHNLATDPAFGATLQKLRAMVDKWMKETGDPRVDPSCDIFDTYYYVGNI